MKLAILTSDIIDGRIVIQELLKNNRNIKAILYEKKHKTFKMCLKLMLLFMCRKLKFINFEDIANHSNGLTVKATEDINENENVIFLKNANPDLIIVIGTRKLKKDIFYVAPFGAINLHSGILPYYRGADSEFWALYNNEPELVGVSVHFIDDGLDSGDMILQQQQQITPQDNHRSLRRKNIYLGAKKINEAIALIESGNYTSLKQDPNLARVYRSAGKNEISQLREKNKARQSRTSCMKLFGNNTTNAKEVVSDKPFIVSMKDTQIKYPRIFCLRIDADEYHSDIFNSYLPLFKKYKDAVTIFINASSFNKAKNAVVECKSIGLDVQSHGFYHYTYNDYVSNRYNIKKAKQFFEDLGIKTIGFAAPYGRWNRNLTQALEDEGYRYSSEFAYDYLGLPSYPNIRERISNVLEIPVFPVAPELFLQENQFEVNAVLNYYKSAIDEMERCAIPVIVYAHTSRFEKMPVLLGEIIEYAILRKGLMPINMTYFYNWWRNRFSNEYTLPLERRVLKVPDEAFIGKYIDLPFIDILKSTLKKTIDFERITPYKELRCSTLKKITKGFLRKFYTQKIGGMNGKVL